MRIRGWSQPIDAVAVCDKGVVTSHSCDVTHSSGSEGRMQVVNGLSGRVPLSARTLGISPRRWSKGTACSLGARTGDGAEHGFAVDENPTRKGVLAISVSESSRLL